MQKQNMIFLFFIAFLLLIFVGYLFVIGEQKNSDSKKKSTTTTADVKKEELGECSFAKRYNLLLVTDSDDEDYVFLTLKEYNVDEVDTVKVRRDVMPSLKMGNYYQFNFSTKKKIRDHIDEIFASSVLINVEDMKKDVDGELEICDTHLIEN